MTNLASHNREYLYFQSPLRGEFEVQGEVPAFGWRDSFLAVGLLSAVIAVLVWWVVREDDNNEQNGGAGEAPAGEL